MLGSYKWFPVGQLVGCSEIVARVEASFVDRYIGVTFSLDVQYRKRLGLLDICFRQLTFGLGD
jgi:hypothetical protein